MIKRVEFFDAYSVRGIKPSRIVSYYLFGFILIYQSIEKKEEFKNLFPKVE